MEVARTALHWGLGWTIAGAATGVALMFGHVELFAESGAKPLGLGAYDVWIVVLGIGGTLFGAGLGGLTSLVIRLWNSGAPGAPSLRRQLPAAALAGAILGGMTRSLDAAAIGGILGAATPAAAYGFGRLSALIRR